MGDAKGFMKHGRKLPTRRPVPVRILDWKEVYEEFPADELQEQASRCMDCGIPFCNNGCPLGNIIPDWNDLTYRNRWEDAIERLHATNNFPEFTGRLCPAPCEAACVLGINQDPVTIKQIEVSIIDRAWDEGWVRPVRPSSLHREARGGHRLGPGRPGRGPAAHPCRAPRHRLRAGRSHRWTAAVRHPRVQDGEAGPRPSPGPDAGRGHRVPHQRQCRHRHHGRASSAPSSMRWSSPPGPPQARDLPIPGRELRRDPPGHGVPAMVEPGPGGRPRRSTRYRSRPRASKVVIIGGGDTGADCLGTAHRQGAEIVHQFEIMPRPPDDRPDANPWPTYPFVYRVSSAHEEGGDRVYAVNTTEFLGNDEGVLPVCDYVEVEQKMVDGRPRSSRSRVPRPSSRSTWCSWRWGSPDPSGRRCWTPSGWISTSVATWPATRRGARPRTGCSSPATPGEGRA